MKKISLLAMVALIATGCSSDDGATVVANSDPQLYKIEFYYPTKAAYEGGTGKKQVSYYNDYLLVADTIFDATGNILERVATTSTGNTKTVTKYIGSNIEYFFEYKFNNGKLIERKRTYTAPNIGDVHEVYTYNADGSITNTSTLVPPLGPPHIEHYYVNEEGYINEWLHQDYDGAIYSIINYNVENGLIESYDAATGTDPDFEYYYNVPQPHGVQSAAAFNQRLLLDEAITGIFKIYEMQHKPLKKDFYNHEKHFNQENYTIYDKRTNPYYPTHEYEAFYFYN